MFLWAKACNTAIFVPNRSPHKILRDKTPKKTFTGLESEIGNLRNFTSPVYIHVLVGKRRKLENNNHKLAIREVYLSRKQSLALSNYVRRPRWFEQTLRDTPTSTLKESKPSNKF